MKEAICAFLFILVMLGSPLSFSEDSKPVVRSWYSENMLLEYRDELKTLKGDSGDSSGCNETYRKIYSRDALDVRIFFGYLNDEADPGKPASDLVSDGYFKSRFIQLLMEPCEENLFACGFALNDDHMPVGLELLESVVLSKQITGPDQKPIQVSVSLESSSVSESDHDNRHKLGSEQKNQTGKISKDFVRALNEADVVLYTGHSRTGTGPGFKPITPISLSGLEAWLFKPSRHKMLRALENATHRPALLGIYSCSSDHYYREHLEEAAPETSLVLTTESLTALEEAHASMLGTLNSIFGLKCEADFKQSLHQSVLYGLFPEHE